MRCDVAVVGGGPAGASAAITLARAGVDVAVFDKASFPRDKCCGDGLTAGALRRLEALGLRPDAVPSWTSVADVSVRSPSGRTVRFPLPDDGSFAVVARRFELDAALLDVARAAGAKVHDGHGVTGVDPARETVRLAVDGIGTVEADYVVAADGMWSPVRKAVDRWDPGDLGEWHAFRQYFRGVGAAGSTQLWVWFDADLLPGYAWSFPLGDGHANVGFGIQRGGRYSVRDMRNLWPEVLARPHVAEVLGSDAVPEAPHKAWPIPARPASLTAAGGRVLFVGDAARVTDPMTGEGIGQALQTGVEAARAVAAAGPDGATAAGDRYAGVVTRGLGVDNRLAGLLSQALRHRKGARAAIRVAGSTAWTRRNFGRWLFEDYPRAVLATPHRWHRRMLSGSGAYR